MYSCMNTYMPNVQCLDTSIVLHKSFTYTHETMNIYAYIHIRTPYINTNIHAQTYIQSHAKMDVHIYFHT